MTTTLSKIKKLKIYNIYEYRYIHLKCILVLLPVETLLRSLKNIYIYC